MSGSVEEYRRVGRIAEALRSRVGTVPRLGLVLGSGLGAFAEGIEAREILPYDELPEFPVPGVDGHHGRLIFGSVRGVDVVAMQGRVHGYEGYTPAEVVRPLRGLVTAGVDVVLITNAAGGLNQGFTPGDLMLIEDQINLTGRSPLIGPMAEAWPCRFVDMTDAFDPALGQAVRDAARARGIDLKAGVYVGLPGASYETPAEVRMLRLLGGDAVGMSTVHEVIAARHLEARVVGVSCITNMAAGMGDVPLTHEDVQETAARIQETFGALVEESIPRIWSLV